MSEEYEPVFIDCQPVNELGETETERDERIKNAGGVDKFLNDATNLIDTGEILDNIGIQVFIGITFFGIIYGLGEYLFKSIPKSIYQKKLYSM